ncbi:response regulator [bacterium]|nr:response regulator [bacterium]
MVKNYHYYRMNRIKRTVFLLLWFVLLAAPVWASQPFTPQTTDPMQDDWRWRDFPSLEGRGVTAMAQTRDGDLWFAVESGLTRYDGLDWHDIHLKTSQVQLPLFSLCALKEGGLLFGAMNGLFKYEQDAVQRVFPAEDNGPWPIEDIIEHSEGSVWCASPFGLVGIRDRAVSLYAPQGMEPFIEKTHPDVHFSPVPDEIIPYYTPFSQMGMLTVYLNQLRQWLVLGLDEEAKGQTALQVGDRIAGNEFLSIADQKELRLNVHRNEETESFRVTVTSDPQRAKMRDFHVYDIEEGPAGEILVALQKGALLRLSLDTHEERPTSAWENLTLANDLRLGMMPSVLARESGEIWLVSDFREADIYHFDGESWNYLDTSFFSPLNTSILETPDGSVWIGGFGAIARWREGEWKVYENQRYPLFGNRHYFYATANGFLWVLGRGQGVRCVDITSQNWLTYKDLIYQCEDGQGGKWFLHKSGAVVRQVDNQWTQYDEKDGLIDTPCRVLASSQGVIFVAGSHNGVAAFAQGTPGDWAIKTFPDFSWGLDYRVVYEDPHGDVWFGSSPDPNPKPGGIIRWHRGGEGEDAQITVYDHMEVPNWSYGISQHQNGKLFLGGYFGLFQFDETNWHSIMRKAVSDDIIDSLLVDRDETVWIGTRNNGIYALQGKEWRNYTKKNNLSGNFIKDIYQTDDGAIWAASKNGIDRFDGLSWMKQSAPPGIRVESSVCIHQSNQGDIWFNSVTDSFFDRAKKQSKSHSPFYTTRYTPDRRAPESRIVSYQNNVNYADYAYIEWEGIDLWYDNPELLMFSYRLDDKNWTPFEKQTQTVFQDLPYGAHTFSLRARDRDFNIDPTPAVITFEVIPPVWRQLWFLALLLGLGTFLLVQTIRLIARDRRLNQANAMLNDANAQLEIRVKERTKELEESHSRLKKEIQDREKLERQMREAQKLESLGILAGGIAHDFNNILQTVMGNANLALMKTAEHSPIQKNLDSIVSASQHASELSQQMLAYSGKGKFIVKPIWMNDFLRDITHLLNSFIPKKVKLDYQLTENLPPFEGDETQIRQIVINLVTNAYEAIGEEVGTVTVATQARHCDVEDLETTNLAFQIGLPHPPAPGLYVCLEITDTGCGMDKPTLEKMFDPFFTTKFTGRGLGLAAVMGIVRGHRGVIHIDSEPGKGTKFKVFFPAQETGEQTKPIEPAEAPNPSMAGKGTILLAEDEPSVCEVSKQMLEELGFTVLTAADGLEAVELFERNAGQITCVILDLTMPNVDGEEAFYEIREIDPSVRVVLSSGYNEQEVTQRFTGQGLAGFIQKPYSFESLQAALNKILG